MLLKTPWRDGTTHLEMSLLQLMQRLATGWCPRRQSACNPRWVRFFSITGCCRIAAMFFSSPPQFGQCSRS